MSASRVVMASLALLALTAAACGDEASSKSSGKSGTSTGTGTGDLPTVVEDLLDTLAGVASVAAAETAAGELCVLIDDNPNYTSNTIFSTGGKQGFAQLIRTAYSNGAFLREFVQGSPYWSASGETISADEVITQSDNSCATNIGFINAVCFASGFQYTSGGAYHASGAVNTGGCDEAKF